MVCTANPIKWIWTLWRTANIYATRVLALYNVRCVYVCMTKELFFRTQKICTRLQKNIYPIVIVFMNFMCSRRGTALTTMVVIWLLLLLKMYIFREYEGQKTNKIFSSAMFARTVVRLSQAPPELFFSWIERSSFFFIFGNVRWIKASAQKKGFYFLSAVRFSKPFVQMAAAKKSHLLTQTKIK